MFLLVIITGYQGYQSTNDLNDLLVSNINDSIEMEGRHYAHLKDISCSLSSMPEKDREYVDMYLNIYKESLGNYLKEDYVRVSTKDKLKGNLEYVPCDCREKKHNTYEPDKC